MKELAELRNQGWKVAGFSAIVVSPHIVYAVLLEREIPEEAGSMQIPMPQVDQSQLPPLRGFPDNLDVDDQD